MALDFYLKVLKNSARNPVYRKQLKHELWDIFRQKLPGRLVTPRAKYVHCIESNPRKPEGRWLPPQSLTWRPASYGLLFNQNDEVLLVLDISLNKHWHLPGGGMNRGETQQDTLAREFKEETGLEVEIGPSVDVWDEFFIMPTGQATHSLLHFFLVKVVGGTLTENGNGFDTGKVTFFYTHPALDLPETKVHWQTLKLQALVEKARNLRRMLNYDSGYPFSVR